MKDITSNRVVAGAIVLGASVGLVGLAHLGGGLANLLRPEIVISLFVIAGLLAHAILDVRAGMPAGFVRRARHRLGSETANTASNIVTLWPTDGRKAA